MLDRLPGKLTNRNMKNRADHADTKQPHAEVVKLFLVTVNHPLKGLKGLIVSLWLTAKL